MKMPNMTIERLREHLTYDSETGILRSTTNGRRVGTMNDSGRRVIRLDGKSYQAHKLAWMFITGAMPESLIRFYDKDPSNTSESNMYNDDTMVDVRFNRKTNRNPMTLDRLNEAVDYDPITGVFRSAIRHIPIGRMNKSGHKIIRIYGNDYSAHNLAWLFMTGKLPKEMLKFKNGIKSDTSFDNLVLKSDYNHDLSVEEEDRHIRRQQDDPTLWKYDVPDGMGGTDHAYGFKSKAEAKVARDQELADMW